MSRASALLQLYKSETLSARDRFAQRYGVRFPGDTGTQVAAMIDMSAALMSGYPFDANSDIATEKLKLDAYKKERWQRLLEIIEAARRKAQIPDSAKIAFDYVPMIGPMAFAIHRSADDSYAIGFDEGLRDLFAVLALATLQSMGKFDAKNELWDGQDLNAYDYYFESSFRLNYSDITDGLLPRLDFLQALYDLAITYQKMHPSIRSFIDDIRDRSIDFVMCHELAHIALGHFEKLKPTSLGMIGNHPSEVSAYAAGPDTFAAEFEADAFAAELMADCTTNDRDRFTAWQAPVLTLTLLKHLQLRAGESTKLANMMRASHPPMDDRLQRLRQLCLSHRPDDDMLPPMIVAMADRLDAYQPDPDNRLFEQT